MFKIVQFGYCGIKVIHNKKALKPQVIKFKKGLKKLEG